MTSGVLRLASCAGLAVLVAQTTILGRGFPEEAEVRVRPTSHSLAAQRLAEVRHGWFCHDCEEEKALQVPIVFGGAPSSPQVWETGKVPEDTPDMFLGMGASDTFFGNGNVTECGDLGVTECTTEPTMCNQSVTPTFCNVVTQCGNGQPTTCMNGDPTTCGNSLSPTECGNGMITFCGNGPVTTCQNGGGANATRCWQESAQTICQGGDGPDDLNTTCSTQGPPNTICPSADGAYTNCGTTQPTMCDIGATSLCAGDANPMPTQCGQDGNIETTCGHGTVETQCGNSRNDVTTVCGNSGSDGPTTCGNGPPTYCANGQMTFCGNGDDTECQNGLPTLCGSGPPTECGNGLLTLCFSPSGMETECGTGPDTQCGSSQQTECGQNNGWPTYCGNGNDTECGDENGAPTICLGNRNETYCGFGPQTECGTDNNAPTACFGNRIQTYCAFGDPTECGTAEGTPTVCFGNRQQTQCGFGPSTQCGVSGTTQQTQCTGQATLCNQTQIGQETRCATFRTQCGTEFEIGQETTCGPILNQGQGPQLCRAPQGRATPEETGFRLDAVTCLPGPVPGDTSPAVRLPCADSVQHLYGSGPSIHRASFIPAPNEL